MAKDKISFLLYCDLIHTVGKLTDVKAGQLFKHVLDYVNDKDPKTDDFIIEITFEPIKQFLKRDLKKYQNTCKKNKESALKRWNKTNTTACDGKRPNTKHADIDSDIGSDIDIDIEKEIIKNNIDFIYKFYPTKCPINNSSTGKSKKDKNKIEKLLIKNTKDQLLFIIETYISECKKSNRYIKNFSTFLNNLPDYEKPEEIKPINDGIKRYSVRYDGFPEVYIHSDKEIKEFELKHSTSVRSKS